MIYFKISGVQTNDIKIEHFIILNYCEKNTESTFFIHNTGIQIILWMEILHNIK